MKTIEKTQEYFFIIITNQNKLTSCSEIERSFRNSTYEQAWTRCVLTDSQNGQGLVDWPEPIDLPKNTFLPIEHQKIPFYQLNMCGKNELQLYVSNKTTQEEIFPWDQSIWGQFILSLVFLSDLLAKTFVEKQNSTQTLV